MKKLIFLLIVSSSFLAVCTAPTSENPEEINRRIPDRTPFISGIVEASTDTIHFYSQVVIGYATDGKFVDEYNEIQHIPKLFSPTHWAQVVRTLQRFTLAFEFENEATAYIIGPLGHENEQEVKLESEGYGVYGDIHSQLELIAGQQYHLKVILPNGHIYSATTFIPEKTEIHIPDSVGLNVTLKHYDDGTPHERSNKYEWIYFDYPNHTFLTETQKNTSIDRELLFLEPEEHFLFEDRGPFFRTGINYAIWKTQNSIDSTRIIWSRTLSKPWVKEEKTESKWRRFAFYSNGMWRNHQYLNNQYSGIGEAWEQMDKEFIQAVQTRDSTFLFEVSTLQKLGKNGEILPKDSLDAFGFFAGNFSLYKKFVVYPIRDFDVDSVYKTQGF